MGNYETVIGLEVHVELATKSKIFCGCSTSFGATPNSQICPVCSGHPGMLPVLNEQALIYALKASMALNCTINDYSKFDRKNYFYPDSPKAYQISQYDKPIGENGWVDIRIGDTIQKIGITRVHLEEDAGKLTHLENGSGSLVDFNRCGIPLIEIVSEPDLRSPEQARVYLEKLRTIILYTGVSDVRMEEGSLRCDANISLRRKGESKLGIKTEMKNLNSFKNVERALLYEEERQAALLDRGEVVVQQSMRWLEAEGRTKLMRSKEEAHDYRYFPEPDLLPLIFSEEFKQQVRQDLPELPDAKIRRYTEDLGLSVYDASVITNSPAVATFFEQTTAEGVEPKQAINWITGEIFAYLNKNGVEINQCRVKPSMLAQLAHLVKQGTINSQIVKKVFKIMLETGHNPETIVSEHDLVQVNDKDSLALEIDKIVSQNPQSVADFKNGKDRALGFIIGQVMKATEGKADPKMLSSMVRKRLEE